MKVKKIYKYEAGNIVPEGAVYLCTKTVTENKVENGKNLEIICFWHYFLVEVEE